MVERRLVKLMRTLLRFLSTLFHEPNPSLTESDLHCPGNGKVTAGTHPGWHNSASTGNNSPPQGRDIEPARIGRRGRTVTTHRSRWSLLAALGALAILAGGCGGGRGAPGPPDIRRIPHTTVGALLLAPPRDATGVDPSQPVIVQTRYSDVLLQKVSVTREGGEAVPGTLTSGRFVAERVLEPDATYTVTAVATLPAAAGGSSPSSEQTETLSFSTQTTPRVLSVSPTVVAPGQSAVVTLDTPARGVKVPGDVSSRLDPGNRVTISPRSYRPGATFSVSLTATNLQGTEGRAQTVRFMVAGGPTASVS